MPSFSALMLFLFCRHYAVCCSVLWLKYPLWGIWRTSPPVMGLFWRDILNWEESCACLHCLNVCLLISLSGFGTGTSKTSSFSDWRLCSFWWEVGQASSVESSAAESCWSGLAAWLFDASLICAKIKWPSNPARNVTVILGRNELFATYLRVGGWQKDSGFY